MPTHSFRKFFKTTAEDQISSLHIEMFMGHSTGLARNYYKPTKGKLLQSYLKLVPHLTILKQASGPVMDLDDLKKRLAELEENDKKKEAQIALLENLYRESGQATNRLLQRLEDGGLVMRTKDGKLLKLHAPEEIAALRAR